MSSSIRITQLEECENQNSRTVILDPYVLLTSTIYSELGKENSINL